MVCYGMCYEFMVMFVVLGKGWYVCGYCLWLMKGRFIMIKCIFYVVSNVVNYVD